MAGITFTGLPGIAIDTALASAPAPNSGKAPRGRARLPAPRLFDLKTPRWRYVYLAADIGHET